MNTISYPKVISTLNQLHYEASREIGKIAKGLSKGIFRKLRPEDMKDTYIAISRQQGAYIYDLLIERKAKHIVEFGTSFGISTLYLGAAAKKNGGKVITTELLPEKCKVAQQNFEQANLLEVIDLREGDALKTLQDVETGIDFLLMDGWNDLYLPLLKLLEPKFRKGTLIYTDNASMRSAKAFIQYIRSNNQYKSVRLKDDKGGSELSEYLN
ncbi:MAG: class I SAM-dependent methyltransferase [Bacteroidota bacterium]